MERLTNCAQGYCEMYCKKYMLCFEDPEDCIFKDEIKLYEAVKSIEGIVPFDRLLELACADKAGRLVVLPCKVGDTVYVIGESCDFCETYLDEPERCMRCEKGHYAEERGFELWMLSELNDSIFLTRDEAEAALAQEGGTHEADPV